MKPRLVTGPGASAGGSAELAFRALAVVLAPYLREVLTASSTDELVDVAASVPRPQRAVYAACRSGAIAGAAKVGRRWLAKRSAVEDWLRSQGPRLVDNGSADAEADELEGMRVALAREHVKRRRA